jgi:prophage antirepressor-like protein
MNSCLTVFNYKGNQTRTVKDEKGEPWFIAKDVCDILEIKNTSKAIAGLDNNEKGITSSDTLKGPQEMLTVNEPGLYRLIMRSRKKEAEEFQRWIAHEVLPAIRKNGAYGTKSDHTTEILSLLVKQQDSIVQILHNLTQTREEPYVKAIPRTIEPERTTAPSGEEGIIKREKRQPLGRNNPLFRKLKSKGHWRTVTMLQRQKLEGQVSFETTRRAIYDGSISIRPTHFFKICDALDFTREETIKVMREYGYEDFIGMLEGL